MKKVIFVIVCLVSALFIFCEKTDKPKCKPKLKFVYVRSDMSNNLPNILDHYYACLAAEILLDEWGDSILSKHLESPDFWDYSFCKIMKGGKFNQDTIKFPKGEVNDYYINLLGNDYKERIQAQIESREILLICDNELPHLINTTQNIDSIMDSDAVFSVPIGLFGTLMTHYKYDMVDSAETKLEYVKRKIKEVKAYKYRTLSEWVDSIRLSKILKQHPLLI